MGQVLENGRPGVRPAGRGAKVSRCALARAQTAEGKLAKSDLDVPDLSTRTGLTGHSCDTISGHSTLSRRPVAPSCSSILLPFD